MKIKVTVIAALALGSQLAIADGTAPEPADITATSASAEVAEPVEKAASKSQIKALKTDVTPSLQSKLDDLMSFDPQPVKADSQAVASVN